MPRKSTIPVIAVGTYHRVIIPEDICESEGQKTKWFTKKNKAQKYAVDLQDRRDDIGRAFFKLSKIDQGLVLTALNRAGDSQTLYDAVEFFFSQRPKKELTLAKMIPLAAEAKRASGKTEHYVKCFETTCTQFAQRREDTLACHIQPHHIQEWLHLKRNPEWSQNTKVNYLRDLRTLFSFGIKNGYCMTNPAERVEKPVLKDSAPAILTVPQVEKLLRAAEEKDRGLIPFLAMCLFAGLRPSEAVRITKENIKASFIEVFGKRTRARNRRLVAINETLRAWLDLGEKFTAANLRKRMAIVRAGIPWEQDCMRHSFVSYHFALYGASTTAKEAGHSETILFKHYRELVTPDEAKKFWAIMPTPKKLWELRRCHNEKGQKVTVSGMGFNQWRLESSER
jgi:site-specific recombinase XerD